VVNLEALNRPDDFRVLKELIGPNGLGLLDDIFVQVLSQNGTKTRQAPSENPYYKVLFMPNRGERVTSFYVDYGELSSGTRRVLRILTYLLFDRNSVMLLEQPEDGLHEWMSQKLISLIRHNADQTQLILASHSSAMLNQLEPKEIRLVSLQKAMTVVRSLTARELNAAFHFMNDQGSLYDFLEPIELE